MGAIRRMAVYTLYFGHMSQKLEDEPVGLHFSAQVPHP